MKLPQYKNVRWNYPLLSFLLPLFGMLCLMLVGRYEPFGNNRSMLYSDMYHQYYPFFLDFRRSILSGEGLLYNWSIGMGVDYLGLISYYLASPLNLLSVLVPESLMLEYFSLLMPLKLGFASLFFAIFLKRIFNKNDLSIVLFGSFYALCAWATGYQWNVMWLDTFALLPLVALGTIRLLRDKKVVLYTVTLFLSIFSNYYIGFFTCIFVLLIFICYEICRFRSVKHLFLDLLRIALFSLLAIGMTAVLELPALAALQNTQSSVNKYPTGFKLNIANKNTWQGLLDAMRQVAGQMAGGHTPSFKEGLPNLYCGVGTVMLSALYLTNSKIKIRDKICSCFLLLFFVVSFILRQLDYIWHGFHFTNMIPYRFSFLYSFVLLYMAYSAYLHRRYWKLWQVILSGILAICVFLCSDSRTDPVFLLYNITFLVFYFCVFLYPLLLKKPKMDNDAEIVNQFKNELSQRRSFTSLALAGVMLMELAMTLVNFGVKFPYTGISNYPKGTVNSSAIFSHMEDLEADTVFYRAEVTHSQTLNDGALNGYNGISTFTSSANVKVTEFMKALGYGAKNTYNRYLFEESSPVANLFLNLKYMIERDGQVENNPYFDDIYQSGSVHLLKNNAYLPLGFLVDSQLADVDFKAYGDPFMLQNRVLNAATDTDITAFNKIAAENLEITGQDVEIKTTTGSGYASYEATANAGSVIYNYTADRSGLMCIYLNLPKKNKIQVSCNGATLYNETYSLPQSFSVCQVNPGDIVQIKLSCKANEQGNTTVTAAILDESVFRNAYNILSQSVWELTSFRSTRVEGMVNSQKDGLLYTSIPENGNWNVYVDGEKTKTVLIGDAMIAVPLSAGEHVVTFQYENQAFSLGWKISLLCAAVFLTFALTVYKPKGKKGEYEV